MSTHRAGRPRTRDRAAATLLTVAALTLPSCTDQGVGVDPVDPDLATYVELVAQAERRLETDPQAVLPILRQLYYGKPWSATSSNPLWRLVIPCSPELPDPRAALGDELFDALASRAETGGVDIGHVFAGLEAMVCPAARVLMAEMSNEDFATWGGDLGAAVAARSACLALGSDAANTADCGGLPGGQPLDFYVAHHAPPQDLEGDLDPFAMRAALMGTPCASSRLVPLELDRPLSEVLGDYYLDPTSALGRARRQRDRCVLELLGATFAADQVANRDVIVDQITTQVSSFAETYYLTIRSTTLESSDKSALQLDARELSDRFVDRLAP